MNSAPPATASAARLAEATRLVLVELFMRLLNDDRTDHARMDRAREVVCTRFVEFVREALVGIHAARLEYPCVADHGVRFIVLVGPSHGRTCFDRQGRGIEHEIFSKDR